MDQELLENFRRDYPSTGRWILEDSKIKTWIDPQKYLIPILWLKGIPGAGK
jgi:hypothetical protein